MDTLVGKVEKLVGGKGHASEHEVKGKEAEETMVV